MKRKFWSILLVLVLSFVITASMCDEEGDGDGDNQNPVAEGSATTQTGSLDVMFSAEGSVDPDGNIVLYEWDFTNDGEYDWESTVNGETSFTYPEQGVYTAVLRVTDDEGATDTDEVPFSIDVDGAIQGMVADNTGAGVPYSTVIAIPTDEEDIYGALVDAVSGEDGNYYLANTNSAGEYLIEDVIPNFYFLMAGYLNYDDNLTSSFTMDTTGIWSGEFSVDPDSIPIDEVVEVSPSETVTHDIGLVPAVKLFYDEDGDGESDGYWPITAGLILNPNPLPVDSAGTYTFMWEAYDSENLDGYAVAIQSLDENNDWVWAWPQTEEDYEMYGMETERIFEGYGWYISDPENLVVIPPGNYKVSVAAILFDPSVEAEGEVVNEEFFSGYFSIPE